MTERSALATRLLGSVDTLLGDDDSLENVITFTLDDGCLCYVAAAHLHYELHRDSTASPSPPNVIKPIAGPGRWVPLQGGGSIVIPFPVSDIDATGIPNGYVVQAIGAVAVWGPVPVAFDILSFACTTGLVQVGATVTNPAFVASYNQPASSVTLTDTDGHTDAIALPGTNLVSPHSFTKNVYGQGVTFTDTAEDDLGSAAATVGIVWGEDIYYGAVADPGVYNQNFITSLTALLQLGAAGNFPINAAAGESAFFCALTSFGLTSGNFFVLGFPFACSRVATNVAVTNAHGILEFYDVFRSDNTGLGAFTLQVEQ